MKGLSDSELAPLASLYLPVDEVKRDRRTSKASAEENRAKLINVQNELDKVYFELNNLVAEKESKKAENTAKADAILNSFLVLRNSIYDAYHNYYKPEFNRLGLEQYDLNNLTYLFNDVKAYINNYKEGVKSFEDFVYGDSEAVYDEYSKRFESEKAKLDAKISVAKEKRGELVVVNDPEVYSAKTTKPKKGLLKKVVKGVLIGALILATAFGLKSCADKKKADALAKSGKNDNQELEVVDATDGISEVKDDQNQTVEVVERGAYGTFTDINDDAQIMDRANYIFDHYFADIYDKLPADQQKTITPEKIAQTIKIMNAQLPVDENGNKFYDLTVIDNYTTTLVDLVVNSQSNKNQEYRHFPAYLLTVDGSEVSEFIKSYDVLYDKLTYAMNMRDDEQAQDAIACLGFKFWNEWYLQGMYDGVEENGVVQHWTNPHSFDNELKYLAFIATVEPFNTTGLEWHLSESKPVCIEACLDYETKERKAIPVNNIHVALETGAWNKVGAKLAGIEVPNDPWLAIYWNVLNDQLTWLYDHDASLKLNK